MKRLTIRNSDGSVSQPTDLTFEKAIYRLAEYEDTGLTPSEIEEMKIDLCDKQAQLENSTIYGEWIPARDAKDGSYVEVCSVCNYVEHYNIGNTTSQAFCPYCGSCNEPPKDKSKPATWV